MDKYYPLQKFLEAQEGSRISLTFGEIESLLADSLPASAHNHRAWWSNEAGGQHVQAHSWLGAGWGVEDVNLTAGRVVFRRRLV